MTRFKVRIPIQIYDWKGNYCPYGVETRHAAPWSETGRWVDVDVYAESADEAEERIKCRLGALLREQYKGEPTCTDCLSMTHCESHHKEPGTYPD